MLFCFFFFFVCFSPLFLIQHHPYGYKLICLYYNPYIELLQFAPTVIFRLAKALYLCLLSQYNEFSVWMTSLY